MVLIKKLTEYIINLTKSSNTIEQILHQKCCEYLKDHSPQQNKSGIYQINCKDCEKIYT